MKQLTNWQSRDVAALLHPYTNAVQLKLTGAHIIERGEGVRVYDQAGRSYIEGLAGLWCCGLGFGEPELIEAARRQMERLPYYHLFGGRSHEPAIELAEKIKELAPDMARVIFQSSGSEANDTQIKLIWYMNNALGRPKKKKILSRRKAYHGVTIVAASLTGLPYNHMDFDLPVPGIIHLSTPHYWREARDGESEAEFVARLRAELIEVIEREGPDTIAAFIAEPVMGAGGAIVPPQGYFEAICPVLREHDIHIIADEVITGFGRTGEWFGSDRLGMARNSMSMAKQLTGGYAPLSAVAMDARMAEVIEANTGRIGNFGHGFTYGGHPVGCAVGVRALELYRERDILGHVRRLEPVFARHMRALADHPLVGDTRSVGLVGAFELSPDKTTAPFAEPGKVGARMAQELLARGVILRAIGDVLAICPPMVITAEELEELFAAIPPALDATLDWARKEGLAK
ncbi:MAG: aspartate aminotransferase family protein [Paracoccaceae bacterium]|nr:MAG: aminotransferase class III-fold pyridoxal phosphate-dependent enzyme [Alphaproteobacteria bacterium]GIX15092.1 MAG: aspartate aminotransferase family protein [Paracoccaceae bacterium]